MVYVGEVIAFDMMLHNEVLGVAAELISPTGIFAAESEWARNSAMQTFCFQEIEASSNELWSHYCIYIPFMAGKIPSQPPAKRILNHG